MYGTPAGVAALSDLWTNDGEWLDDDEVYQIEATDPSLSQITTWLEEVSATVNGRASDEGFITPITDEEVIKDISGLVNGIVKDLADYSHGSGRFYSKQAIKASLSPYLTIDKEISDWVARRSIGWSALGIAKHPNVKGRTEASFEVLG